LPAARVGAAAHPAYREVGWRSKEDNVAYINACRLERRPEIQDRIGYLTRQEERLIAEKRQRIEEQLWAIHEANIQDLFEIYEQPKTTKDGKIETDQNGQMRVERKERPRAISELSPDIAKLIEDVTADSKGRLIPKVYSKLQASRELRAMLNIGRPERESDVTRLSDAELIQQLADQAKELGIEIDLNYRFAQKPDE
jgi:hypothetical protein